MRQHLVPPSAASETIRLALPEQANMVSLHAAQRWSNNVSSERLDCAGHRRTHAWLEQRALVVLAAAATTAWHMRQQGDTALPGLLGPACCA